MSRKIDKHEDYFLYSMCEEEYQKKQHKANKPKTSKRQRTGFILFLIAMATEALGYERIWVFVLITLIFVYWICKVQEEEEQ